MMCFFVLLPFGVFFVPSLLGRAPRVLHCFGEQFCRIPSWPERKGRAAISWILRAGG